MEKIPYEQVCKLFESKGYKIIGQYERTGKSVLCEQISTGYRCFGKYNDLKAGNIEKHKESQNSRSKSAKLRVFERVEDGMESREAL